MLYFLPGIRHGHWTDANTIKGSAVTLLFIVAKAAHGNCIYSVMFFAYLSNIRTRSLKHFSWSNQLRMVQFFFGSTEATKGLVYHCAVS